MRIMKRALLVVLGVYVVLAAALYLEQTRFIFVPQREVEFTPKVFGCDFQRVSIPSESGSMEAWWLSADPRLSAQMGGRTVIYFHGNGGSIGANAEHACRLRNIGFNVLLFDYRGYGQSSSVSPSEDTVYADADSAWNYLTRERNVVPHKTIIYGHSLGGAVAIEMAKRHPDATALITESAFTSIRAMADRDIKSSLFPMALILNQRMDSLSKIRNIHMPKLFIHGTADDVVPPSMAQQLYVAAPAKKQLFLVDGAGHENCAAIAGEKYQATVRSFLTAAD